MCPSIRPEVYEHHPEQTLIHHFPHSPSDSSAPPAQPTPSYPPTTLYTPSLLASLPTPTPNEPRHRIRPNHRFPPFHPLLFRLHLLFRPLHLFLQPSSLPLSLIQRLFKCPPLFRPRSRGFPRCIPSYRYRPFHRFHGGWNHPLETLEAITFFLFCLPCKSLEAFPFSCEVGGSVDWADGGGFG